MSIFSRLFEKKKSAVGSMVSSYLLGRPSWPERRFDQLAKEGYQRNVIVYSCVWLASKSAADIPLVITRDGKEIEKGAEDILQLLHRPNPLQDGFTWRQSLISDYLIGGNAFMERVDISGKPRELYRWRPDRTAVVLGPDGYPASYEYKVDGVSRQVPIDVSKGIIPILHWKDYHPINDVYGMSPLDPAAFSVDSSTSASAWNKALLDNSAQPSGALIYTPKEGSGKLSDEQWARLKAELDDSFSGSRNAGKPLLLDGGMEWKEMGLSPRDMMFEANKNSSARDIALAIGVPPLLLGIPGDNTFSNYTEANKAFYRQTVIPLLSQMCRALNWWLLRYTPFTIEPDIDDLPVFSDEHAQRWDRIEKSTVLSVNEKREALGFEPVDGGDIILVQSSMVPLESAVTPIEGGSEPTDEEIDEI